MVQTQGPHLHEQDLVKTEEKKERKQKTQAPREGWEDGTPPPAQRKKERKKTDNPREGWEDGTPPPHRDFKERCVVR